MIVYRFLDKNAGLSTIKDRKLRVSRLSNLNDPFEFLSADLSDKQFRRAFIKMKNQMAKSRGIICFSKSWQNPVLWGHYADRYRGLCLGFEIDERNLSEINYVKNRIPCSTDIDENLMDKILKSKFEHWGYEEEYRLFCSLDEMHNDGHYYIDFSDDVRLRTVMVGPGAELSRTELSEAIGDLRQGIRAFKVRPAFREFKVVKNRNEKMWS